MATNKNLMWPFQMDLIAFISWAPGLLPGIDYFTGSGPVLGRIMRRISSQVKTF